MDEKHCVVCKGEIGLQQLQETHVSSDGFVGPIRIDFHLRCVKEALENPGAFTEAHVNQAFNAVDWMRSHLKKADEYRRKVQEAKLAVARFEARLKGGEAPEKQVARRAGRTTSEDEFKKLTSGDIVRHVLHPDIQFVVVANYGAHVTLTAVYAMDMTNHSEWELVARAQYALEGDE